MAATAAIAAPGAQAANFPVTNTTNAAAGSLRAAIVAANGSAGPDTITFSGAGASGEIVLSSEIPITDDVTITGPGAAQLAVSGDSDNDNVRDFATSPVLLGDTRIFSISDATSPGSPLMNVSISGLTLKEGVADFWDGGGPQSRDGGAIYANDVALGLSNMTFADNVATNDGGAVHLGGASGDGSLSIANSSFSGNRTKSEGGAVWVETSKYGPGQPARAQITNSQITNNRAGGTDFGAFGYSVSPQAGGVSGKYGGIAITGSTLTGNTAQTTTGGDTNGEGGAIVAGIFSSIDDSTISGNSAGEVGGGLSLFGTRVNRSTISGNSVVDGVGGGVLARAGKYIGGPTRINQSTIAGNSVSGTVDPFNGFGGGVAAYGYDVAVQVENSTIAGNTTSRRGGGVFALGVSDRRTAELQSTIVADNVAAGAPSDSLSQVFDPVSSGAVDDPGGIAAGFSLIETPDTAPGGAPAGSNITGIDPQLGPLAANGGPTQTMALGPTSAAIDSAQANGFATDQAGHVRTVDAVATNAPLSDGTDIGAFELQDPGAVGGDPTTEFTKKPPKKAKLKPNKKTAKVKLKFGGTINSGAPGPLTFECKVDKGGYQECASPLKLKLDKGKHKIEVRAIDSTGRTDSTPAKAKIKVKKKKPKK